MWNTVWPNWWSWVIRWEAFIKFKHSWRWNVIFAVTKTVVSFKWFWFNNIIKSKVIWSGCRQQVVSLSWQYSSLTVSLDLLDSSSCVSAHHLSRCSVESSSASLEIINFGDLSPSPPYMHMGHVDRVLGSPGTIVIQPWWLRDLQYFQVCPIQTG